MRKAPARFILFLAREGIPKMQHLYELEKERAN